MISAEINDKKIVIFIKSSDISQEIQLQCVRLFLTQYISIFFTYLLFIKQYFSNNMLSGFLKSIKKTFKTKPQPPKGLIVETVKTISGKTMQKKYIKHKLLGSGAFAQCYLTENIETKKVYATKIISKNCQNRAKLLNELVIHQQLHHENVVDFSHAYQDENDIYVFMELCINDSLEHLLQKKYILSTPQIQKITFQIIQGVNYIHSKNLIHRDLKPRNIFLAQGNIVKIGDFGQACKLESEADKKTIPCGTPQYMAPELIGGKSYGKQVDVWAIGVMLYQMYTGRTPFLDESNELIKNNILNLKYVYSQKGIPKQALVLIRKMLLRNPQLRPSLDEILQSSFFKQLQVEKSNMLSPQKVKSFNLNFQQSSVFKNANISKLEYTVIPKQKKLKKKCPYIIEIRELGTQIVLYTMSNGSVGLYAKNQEIIFQGSKQIRIKFNKSIENKDNSINKEKNEKLQAILQNYKLKRQNVIQYVQQSKYHQQVYLTKFSKHRNILICRLSNNFIQLRFEDKTSLLTNLTNSQENTLYINEYNIITELTYQQLFFSQTDYKGIEIDKLMYAKRIYKSLGIIQKKKTTKKMKP